MSIASEITRLQNAKAALKTSINNKGGTITTELIDAYAPFVDSIATQKPEETKTIASPSFASGDIVVTPDSGRVLTSVTLSKDTTNHIASNIKSGVTLYGVSGNVSPAKEEETKTVSSPDFSSGNIVVTPTSGKVITQVTINKDTTNHIADNIKEGITLYGVLGTFAGGGGGLPIDTTNYSIVIVTGYGMTLSTYATISRAILKCFNGATPVDIEGTLITDMNNDPKTFTHLFLVPSGYTIKECYYRGSGGEIDNDGFTAYGALKDGVSQAINVYTGYISTVTDTKVWDFTTAITASVLFVYWASYKD